MTIPRQVSDQPVTKSITVKATAERAFDVFTAGIDTWWPREHHIGKSPMKRCVIETRLGGRCYCEQEDGTDSDWGQVIAWEPPRRFVMAWQINSAWQYEPDLAKCSEVEVRFTAEPGGSTRVDLEHRFFGRVGPGGEAMRAMVDQPMGWGLTLQKFAAEADRAN